MGVQEVTPPIRNSTWVKDILVIERVWVQNLINGVQEVTPPIRNSTWVKGILVIERSMVQNLINGGAGSRFANQKSN